MQCGSIACVPGYLGIQPSPLAMLAKGNKFVPPSFQTIFELSQQQTKQLWDSGRLENGEMFRTEWKSSPDYVSATDCRERNKWPFLYWTSTVYSCWSIEEPGILTLKRKKDRGEERKGRKGEREERREGRWKREREKKRQYFSDK